MNLKLTKKETSSWEEEKKEAFCVQQNGGKKQKRYAFKVEHSPISIEAETTIAREKKKKESVPWPTESQRGKESIFLHL